MRVRRQGHIIMTVLNSVVEELSSNEPVKVRYIVLFETIFAGLIEIISLEMKDKDGLERQRKPL